MKYQTKLLFMLLCLPAVSLLAEDDPRKDWLKHRKDRLAVLDKISKDEWRQEQTALAAKSAELWNYWSLHWKEWGSAVGISILVNLGMSRGRRWISRRRFSRK